MKAAVYPGVRDVGTWEAQAPGIQNEDNVIAGGIVTAICVISSSAAPGSIAVAPDRQFHAGGSEA